MLSFVSDEPIDLFIFAIALFFLVHNYAGLQYNLEFGLLFLLLVLMKHLEA